MKTCLVVDDSKVVRLVAGKILRQLDFVVTEAIDGREALEQCDRKMPDAVLLDWKMPLMDSLQFLREMRTLPGGDEPVVVFCSAEDGGVDVSEAISAGANEYLIKPFDGSAIEATFSQTGLI